MILNKAAQDVLKERHRQISAEGWTPELDDQYTRAELALAAGCYTWKGSRPDYEYAAYLPEGDPPSNWPWASEWWKPRGRRRDLVRAAALLIAEIERLDRLSEREEGKA